MTDRVMPDYDDLVERLAAIEEELRDLAYDRLRQARAPDEATCAPPRPGDAAAAGPPRDRQGDRRASASVHDRRPTSPMRGIGPFADAAADSPVRSADGERRATRRSRLDAALDAGINLIDTAPMYGACEAVIAAGVRRRAARRRSHHDQVPARRADASGPSPRSSRQSLDASLAAMRLDHVDVFFLHSNICEDDTVYAHGNDQRARFATPWSQYVDEVVPAFEDLQRRGRIGAWGITGVGVPGNDHQGAAARREAERRAGDHEPARFARRHPPVRRAAAPARRSSPRRTRHGVGVMGIRAVQAGALTAAFDRAVKASHPDAADYRTGRAVPRAVRRARRRSRAARAPVRARHGRASTPSCSASRTAPSSRNASRPKRASSWAPTRGRSARAERLVRGRTSISARRRA